MLEVEDSAQEVVLRTPRQIAWARFRRNKTGVVSLGAVLFFIFLAYGAPIVTRIFGVSSTETYLDGLDNQAMPIGFGGGISWDHPFGLEPGAGRDVFAMLLYGSRISFSVAIITSVTTIGIGMLLGITAGFYRGRIDAIIGRLLRYLFRW